MICRLCLNNLSGRNRIPLFNVTETNGESLMVKVIAKYLHLEITQNDALSTEICKICCQHLEDLHRFCVYIEKQQSTLRNEFFEITCNIKVNPEEVNKEESLLDIQDVLPNGNADSISTEPIEFKMKYEIEESDGVFGQESNKMESGKDDIPLKCLEECNDNTETDNTLQKDIECNDKINTVKKTKEKVETLNLKKLKSTININKEKIPKKTKTKIAKNSLKSSVNKTIQKNAQRKPISPEESEEMHQFITKYMQMKCHVCDASFEKFANVHQHFKKQHKGMRPCIMCCGSRFITQKYLFEHVHWHFNPEYFKCDSCDKTFKNRACLKLHIIDQHEKNEESCVRCPHCPKTFSRQTVLNQHVNMRHTAERMYACELCDKSFIIKQHLTKHIQSIHKNIYAHICDFCGKKFKWKISFENHVLEHQGIVEPPVDCKICGKFFKNKGLLNRHMTHHDTTDVKCKYCGHESPTVGALRGHIYYQHRLQTNHQCSYCNKVFKKQKNLQEHVATHTGQNLYNCQYCDKEFRSNANMYVHVKRQHPHEWSAAEFKRHKGDSKVNDENKK